MLFRSAPSRNPDEIGIDSDDDVEDDDNKDVSESNVGINDTTQPRPINRSHLELPKPSNSCILGTDNALFATDSSHCDDKGSDSVMTEEFLEDCQKLEPQKKVLKLKRRNQSLYTSNDNAEDSDD